MPLKLSHDDIRCLKFLWKWKLCTTALLKGAVYTQKSNYRTYRRLLDLSKAKLVRTIISNDGNSYLWLLTENGFEFIKDYLPTLKTDGYKSENRDHDFWVTAIHIGEWLDCYPKNCDTFSEQQLRHIDFPNYPDWVPKTSTHRPDGWWNIALGRPQNQSLIALEVELSRKTPHSYKTLGHYYSKTVTPYQVIWIVTNTKEKTFILKYLKEGSASQASEQSFITIDQYIEKQWLSQIEDGKNMGKTIIEILGQSPETSPKQFSGSFPLDTRKCPRVSSINRIIRTPQVGVNRNE